jgi:hypothetical protein
VRVGGPSDAALAIFPPLKLPEAHYRCLFSRDGMRRPRHNPLHQPGRCHLRLDPNTRHKAVACRDAHGGLIIRAKNAFTRTPPSGSSSPLRAKEPAAAFIRLRM